jgi:hypothetical protein
MNIGLGLGSKAINTGVLLAVNTPTPLAIGAVAVAGGVAIKKSIDKNTVKKDEVLTGKEKDIIKNGGIIDATERMNNEFKEDIEKFQIMNKQLNQYTMKYSEIAISDIDEYNNETYGTAGSYQTSYGNLIISKITITDDYDSKRYPNSTYIIEASGEDIDYLNITFKDNLVNINKSIFKTIIESAIKDVKHRFRAKELKVEIELNCNRQVKRDAEKIIMNIVNDLYKNDKRKIARY